MGQQCCKDDDISSNRTMPNAIQQREWILPSSRVENTEAPAGRQHWILWNELDMRDEIEKLKVAQFLGRLQERVLERHSCEENHLPRTHSFHLDHITVDASTPRERPTTTQLEEEETRRIVNLARRQAMCHSTIILHPELILSITTKATEILRREPTAMRLEAPTAESPVTVVGDIHGNMEDLDLILAQQGWPSLTNRYIFLGDYVDRGSAGVEVLVALLAMKSGCPEGSVTLLRGNHEDYLMNRPYGFDKQTVELFGKPVYKSFVKAFAALPLCALLEGTAFLMHAGCPRWVDTKGTPVDWRRLENIDRCRILSFTTIVSKSTSDLSLQQTSKFEQDWVIAQDLVWSDPTDNVLSEPLQRGKRRHEWVDRKFGAVTNVRRGGAGLAYSDRFARSWIDHLQVRYIIRGHEMCEHGHAFMPCGDGTGVFTVFSASNYDGRSNDGAVLRFTSQSGKPQVIEHQHRPLAADMDSQGEFEHQNQLALAEAIVKFQPDLHKAMAQQAEEGSTELTKEQLFHVLDQVIGMGDAVIPWSSLDVLFAASIDIQTDKIDYVKFLDGFQASLNQVDTTTLYAHQDWLQCVFYELDQDGDGIISREEWLQGCEWVNSELGDGDRLDGERLYDIIDIDNSGRIDMNELFESFRISSQFSGGAISYTIKQRLMLETFMEMWRGAGRFDRHPSRRCLAQWRLNAV